MQRSSMSQMQRQASRLNPGIGRFSMLGFVGFCSAFAAAAWLIESNSSAPIVPMTPTENSNEFRQPPGNMPIPESADTNTKGPTNGPQNPDHFNRHERLRTPWVLRSAASLSQAQTRSSQQQQAQEERKLAMEDRKRAAVARQNDTKRRQDEIDRFSESRRFVQEQMRPGDETPRGRSVERFSTQMPPTRQRSISTASSYSASSDDSW